MFSQIKTESLTLHSYTYFLGKDFLTAYVIYVAVVMNNCVAQLLDSELGSITYKHVMLKKLFLIECKTKGI